jgi:hypothetical protein
MKHPAIERRTGTENDGENHPCVFSEPVDEAAAEHADQEEDIPPKLSSSFLPQNLPAKNQSSLRPGRDKNPHSFRDELQGRVGKTP